MAERVPRSVRIDLDSWDALIEVCQENQERPADVINRLLHKHLQTYHSAVLTTMKGRNTTNGRTDSVR